MHRSKINSNPNGITVRDAVHLDMEFSPLEAEVIDTPQLQRLRNIKQLGFAHLVYPSANHTRFEHSLGVCHLTGIMIDRISEKGHHRFKEKDRAIARAFALVHDASHIPFGHTLEDEHNVFQRHDKGTRLLQIVDQPELRNALDYLYEPVRAIIEHLGSESSSNHRTIHPLFDHYLVDIVAGTIGADLLDYLRRDNLITGLKREYDPRVLDYFEIHQGQLVVNLKKHGMVRIDAVSDVMDLLRMRYTLAEKVYYHHTKLAFGAVLAQAVRIAKEANSINEQLLVQMGDWELLNFLANGSKVPELVKTLTKRITPRVKYRRAYTLPRHAFDPSDEAFNTFLEKYRRDQKRLQALEASIAEKAVVPSEDVVAYCPSRNMQLKEAEVPVLVNDKIVSLVEWISKTPEEARPSEEARFYYEKFKHLWTFYVFVYGDKSTAERVGKATSEILDKRNYYKHELTE